MEEILRKLTEEEKQKIIYVINDFFSEYYHEDSPESEYITEYDILMKEKEEEFKLYLLGDEYSYDFLLEVCEDYIKGKKTKEGVASVLWFLIEYEMWLNKSGCWPIQHNPEWAKWAKLKEKKVKKKEK